MDNIDDDYAKTHPNALAIGWSSGIANAHDLNGDDVAANQLVREAVPLIISLYIGTAI